MTERAELCAALSEAGRRTAARNLVLRSRQRDLLARLAAAGIPALAVKGVGLVEALYPDLSCREVCDVDLLVRPADVPAAFEALAAAGLRPNHPWTRSGVSRLLARPLALAPELVFSGPDGELVELHWDWPTGELPAGDPFADPEAYLVYLCRHAGKHFWSQSKWTGDIERFVARRGAEMDWSRFWRIARGCGAVRSCAVSLELCRGAEEARPPGLKARLDGAARRLAAQALAERANPPSSRWAPVWRQLRLASWRDRARMAAAWLGPQPHNWNCDAGQSPPAWRLWAERAGHLWRRWAPARASRLSAGDWFLLAEAYATVLWAELARRTLPTRRLLASARRARGAGQAWSADRLRRLARLVEAAANRQPFAVHCLTRSLALAWMLRRRGLAPEVRIGVKYETAALQAHAWVECGGEVLNGPDSQAQEYAVLP